MATVLITDHGFPSIQLQREVIEGAGFALEEAKPACKTEEELIANCDRADALLVQWAPITRRVLESLPRVKCIVRYGVGVDNIDLNAARALGKVVANVPTYCLDEVSDHTLAMILSLARRIPQDHRHIMEGGWGVTPFLPIPAFSDLTLGLIGFGAIARKVSEKAKVFRFRQIASDPFVPDEVFAQFRVERVDQNILFKSADIITLHCPLLPETKHLINRDQIAQMKAGVILVNAARGALIIEVDLIEALKSGKISGAGLDVFEKEPLPVESPLRALNNVILTSHAASVSKRARDLLQIGAAEAIRDFLQGKRPEGKLV